jgi:basic membrane protein A and related proteins
VATRLVYAGALAVAVLAATALAACSHPGRLKVALAYNVGGRGDKSFNDAAAAGLDRVRAELGARVSQVRELSARNNESENDKYDRLKLLCGAGFDVVIAVGYEYAGVDPRTGPLAQAAKECGKTRFAIVDDARVQAPNVAGLVFADEQGSFLVGAAAGLKSRTGRVGFVGGCDNAVIGRFEAGYRAGVREVRPDATITTTYLSPDRLPCPGFSDVEGAKKAAQDLYDGGADVVFHAAGGSGLGVFEAAGESPGSRMAIGVDSDQYQTVPPPLRDTILTSMVKHVDTAVFDVVRSVVDNRFAAGEHRFDLASGGVGYATSGGRVDDISAKLEGYKEKIIIGSVEVPSRVG